MMKIQAARLGPLADGAKVVIIGGGPGGAGAAIALKNLAQRMGREIHVTLFEGKTFAGERHFNQCVGVLSPPIEQILEDQLSVPFPRHLIQRRITGYILHSDHCSIVLESDDGPAYSIRRIQFDDYMLEQARTRGVEIVASRVTGVEFHADRVIVYSESGNCQADALIGAFGSDEGASVMFERATAYRAPRYLSSILTKLHPQPRIMDSFGSRIHAFLTSTRAIEFGAVTPKGNHLTMNIAGEKVDSVSMDLFLHSKAVRAVLPPLEEAQACNDLSFFKGRFPMSQARAFFGDRYAMVGDAAGLVRPFKGKGVNSALLSAIWAAETMMTRGISARALQAYRAACREITADLPYGKAMRALAKSLVKWNLFDLVIALAENDRHLRRALYGAVSAHQPYRAIVHEAMDPGWIMQLGWSSAKLLLSRTRRH